MAVDEINSIRPSRVGPLGRITKFVNNRRKLYGQSAHADPGYRRTFFLAFRAGEDNLIANIALHLPDITGVRLRNVYYEESHPVPILLIKFVEGRNLPPEWRSGVAAENQHNWFCLFSDFNSMVSLLSSLGRKKSGACSPTFRVPARACIHRVSNGYRRKTTGAGIRAITRPNFSGD
jgi:hypothetical protein